MSILVIESFEKAVMDTLDVSVGDDRKYINPETAAAFFAWCKAREGIVVSLPIPAATGGEGDLFSRDQIVEMVGAAGISVIS